MGCYMCDKFEGQNYFSPIVFLVINAFHTQKCCSFFFPFSSSFCNTHTHKLASDKLEKIHSWQEWYITSSLAFSSSVFVIFVCLLLCNNDFFLNEAISYVFCLVFFFWKFFWMICFLDLIFLDDASAQNFFYFFKNTFRYSYLYCWRGSFANYYSFFSLITQCEKSAKKWFILGGDCMGVTRGGGIA